MLCNDKEETYPNVPKPVIVDASPEELIKLTDASPATVEAISVGSIKLLIYVASPADVLINSLSSKVLSCEYCVSISQSI